LDERRSGDIWKPARCSPGDWSNRQAPTVSIPTDLASFLELVRQHGNVVYTLMFAYSGGHSLLFAMFAGYAAHAGALSVGPLIAVCWLGSFMGDVVRFWIGRTFGTRWLRSFPRLERAVDRAVHLANRHHVWMILFHRYPHCIRSVAGFAYGMSPLPWSTFLVLNFVAAGVWASAVVATGYAFGRVSEKVMTQASSGLGVVMLAAFLGASWVLSKRLERALQRG
jgi:membrane protein DedA with SNARE-associated domain